MARSLREKVARKIEDCINAIGENTGFESGFDRLNRDDGDIDDIEQEHLECMLRHADKIIATVKRDINAKG